MIEFRGPYNKKVTGMQVESIRHLSLSTWLLGTWSSLGFLALVCLLHLTLDFNFILAFC